MKYLPLLTLLCLACLPELVTTETDIHEAHRPLFHFTPDSAWMNDPNGMVYLDGEYHLFYQFYPDSTVWGPMHWGHAVSTDLVDWEHLPVALYPDSLGYIFSGSAVIDHDDTAGFGAGAMVAMFTHHNIDGERAKRIDFQTQSIAYSTDKGRTWTKYAGNPVIPNPGIKDFRDPKVTWDAERRQWVMVLAAWDIVKFYTSPDLKNWSFASDFGKTLGSHGGVWECPDLFSMVNDRGEQQWVLIVSVQKGSPNGGTGAQYFVGQWNGTEFIPEPALVDYLEADTNQVLWLDHGRDNYAGVTWSNAPDERTLFLGWMSNWQYAQVVPTERWRSAMTLPRELSLIATTENRHALRIKPVPELQTLRAHSVRLDAPRALQSREIYQPDLDADLGTSALSAATAEVLLEAGFSDNEDPAAPASGEFGIRVFNGKGEEVRLGYDFATGRPFTDRTRSGNTGFQKDFATGRHYGPQQPFTGNWRVFFDRSSVEFFSASGDFVMTDIYFPTEPFHRLEVYNTSDREVGLKNFEIFELTGK